MDKKVSQLFDLFKVTFVSHIETKTICPTFHPKSAEFYEILFEIFHQVAEKRQDIGEDEPADEETAIQDTYDSLIEAKGILEAMVEENNSVGMDNLLRGLIDSLEGNIGDCKAFLEEEKEEK